MCLYNQCICLCHFCQFNSHKIAKFDSSANHVGERDKSPFERHCESQTDTDTHTLALIYMAPRPITFTCDSVQFFDYLSGYHLRFLNENVDLISRFIFPFSLFFASFQIVTRCTVVYLYPGKERFI